MKQYRIPNTDLDVSRLAYGTWHMGGTWDEVPVSAEIDQRTNKLISTAVEQRNAQRLKVRVKPSGTDCRHQSKHRGEGTAERRGTPHHR